MPETCGELNYAITSQVDEYLVRAGGVRYAHLNEVVGALECAKLELCRRVAAPYEDTMIERMGENDRIVTRYMADQDFQASAFPILAREIFEAVRGRPAEERSGVEISATDDYNQKGA